LGFVNKALADCLDLAHRVTENSKMFSQVCVGVLSALALVSLQVVSAADAPGVDAAAADFPNAFVVFFDPEALPGWGTWYVWPGIIGIVPTLIHIIGAPISAIISGLLSICKK